MGKTPCAYSWRWWPTNASDLEYSPAKISAEGPLRVGVRLCTVRLGYNADRVPPIHLFDFFLIFLIFSIEIINWGEIEHQNFHHRTPSWCWLNHYKICSVPQRNVKLSQNVDQNCNNYKRTLFGINYCQMWLRAFSYDFSLIPDPIQQQLRHWKTQICRYFKFGFQFFSYRSLMMNFA